MNKTLLLLCLVSSSVAAQKQTSNWYFGLYGGISFASGAPEAVFNSAMITFIPSSVMSDAAGRLLFYTDGQTVWNRNNQEMPNGHGLWGGDISAQTLIVPKPGNDPVYYIFTAPVDFNSVLPGITPGFFYSVVDLSKDDNLGDVVSKNVFLFGNTTEKMSAVRHANQTDVWVVAHEWGNNVFRSYLITQAGIDTSRVVRSITGVVHIGGEPFQGTNTNAAGQMKLSPDGSRLAAAVGALGVQVFDFDHATGLVSHPTGLLQEPINSNTDSCTLFYPGLEFSPDSKLLYYNIVYYCPSNPYGNSYIRQFNVETQGAPRIVISQYDINSELQLALDGKIYFLSTSARLSAISHPNQEDDIGYVESAVEFDRFSAYTGLPGFMASYFDFPDPVLEMPNVFTPDEGDTINVRFRPIRFDNINQASLTIVNRWGQEVYFTNDLPAGWDGSGLPDGIYYWFLSYAGNNGKSGKQRGFVQVLRQ